MAYKLRMLRFDDYFSELCNIRKVINYDNILSYIQIFGKADLAIDRANLLNKYQQFKISDLDIPHSCDFLYKCEYTNIDDICSIVSEYYIQKAKSEHKRLAVMWSGGVDSTLTTIAFLKNKNLNLSDFYLLLTEESISENEYFFVNFIKNKCHYILYDSYNYREFINNLSANKQFLFITGNRGDSLFFSPYDNELEKLYGEQWKFVLKEVYYIYIGNTPYLDKIVEKHKSIYQKYFGDLNLNINTVFDFLWILTFMFGQIYVDLDCILLSENYDLVNSCFSFFSHNLFQSWAIYRRQYNPYYHNILSNSKKYKKEFKDYIYRYDGNQEYLYNKAKQISLVHRDILSDYSQFRVMDNNNIYTYRVYNKRRDKFSVIYEIFKYLKNYRQ